MREANENQINTSVTSEKYVIVLTKRKEEEK